MALNPKQVEEFRRVLQKRAAALEQELRDGVERLREDTQPNLAGAVPDTGDASLADLITDLDNAELSRDLQDLREVQAALVRADAGTYGECIDCGRTIDLARLRAQPAATRCIDCQNKHERTFVVPGTPTL